MSQIEIDQDQKSLHCSSGGRALAGGIFFIILLKISASSTNSRTAIHSAWKEWIWDSTKEVDVFRPTAWRLGVDSAKVGSSEIFFSPNQVWLGSKQAVSAIEIRIFLRRVFDILGLGFAGDRFIFCAISIFATDRQIHLLCNLYLHPQKFKIMFLRIHWYSIESTFSFKIHHWIIILSSLSDRITMKPMQGQ